MDLKGAIAIVGIGGMFPGAKNINEFWHLLKHGENHVKEIPKHRWNNDAFYNPDPNAGGKLYTTHAGLMDRHDEWDNRLFGISDAESERIDLQQRYTLECVHMAMEDGGITRKDLSGSKTGVYIGCMNDDYKMALYDDFKVGMNPEKEKDANYSVTGTSTSIISARVSYVYNLLGPSMTIDTACSSSLVAIHLGCQSIQLDETDMAICGGVSSIMYPETFLTLCRARMMSPKGQCHAFSDMADGYARGEGCGIVILQRLETAIQQNRKIWAVISTGCNQDGATAHPITAPSTQQQLELLKTVYERHNIDKSQIQYIEAHGTGTPVGDPIEANVLGAFFTGDDIRNAKLPIGSVKSNIGHLESSAGAAGLIKVLLMMKYGLIVRSLHIDPEKKNFNPKIDFDKYDIRIPLENEVWEPNEEERRVACVNSFGFGGTNSHAIIQQIQVPKKKFNNIKPATVPFLLCVSAADRVSLRGCLVHLKSCFEKEEDYDLADVSFTSTRRRDHFEYRVSFLAARNTDVVQECDTILTTIETRKPARAQAMRFVFVFCGVGTTWNGMCKEMLLSENAFRDAVILVDKLLTPLTTWSILEKLETSSDLSDPFTSHIAIFACQIGLYHLWKSWGIKPDAVVGQSVGEVAAAYASGAIGLADAVKVIYHRSRILAKKTGGAMMVVSNVNVENIKDMCAKDIGNVDIAVYSSPKACTIAGNTDAIEIIKERIKNEYKSENVFLKVLDVLCAYHSQHVDSCQLEVQENLKELHGGTPYVEHYSTVIGKQILDNSISTGAYWAKNVRYPVQFSQAIEQSSRTDYLNVFIELGPRPVLHGHIKNILPNTSTLCLSSMKDSDERRTILTSLRALYEHGMNLEWENIIPERETVTDIPQYYFNKIKGLYEPELTQLRRDGIITVARVHPFISPATGNCRFKVHIDPASTPFVFDHKLQETVLVPGATYAEIAFFIGTDLLKMTPDNIEVSLDFKRPVTPSQAKGCELYVSTEEVKVGCLQFIVKHKDVVVTTGTIGKRTLPRRLPVQLRSIKERCIHECDVYEILENIGLTYGDTLTINAKTWRNQTESLTELVVPDSIVDDMKHTILHPAVLDAMFQAIAVITSGNPDDKRLPKSVSHLVYNQFLQRNMYAYTKVYPDGHYNSLLTTIDGHVIVEYTHLYTQTIGDPRNGDPNLAFWQPWQNYVIESEIQMASSCTKKIFLAFTCNIERMAQLESLSVNGSVKPILINGLSLGQRFFRDAIGMIPSDSLGGIIYAPGQRLQSHCEDSKVIFDTVKKSFKQLSDLIMVLFEQNYFIPLFVVTEATQNVKLLEASEPNVYGAELWGLATSVTKEGVMTRKEGTPQGIYLIDICSELEYGVSQLGVLISVVSSGKCPPEFPEELAIVDGVLYYKTFARFDEKLLEPMSNVQQVEDGQMALIKSSQPDTVHEPCLVVSDIVREENTVTVKYNDKLDEPVTIALEEICLHSKNIYSLTDDQDTDCSDMWKNVEKSDYQILHLEAVGYETAFSPEKDKFTRKTKLVVCYPMASETYISVPRYATFPINSLRNYRPGLLTAGTILWSIANKVNRDHLLAIIDEQSLHLRELVESLFRHRGQKVTVLTVNQIKRENTFDEKAIVLLACVKSVDEWFQRCLGHGYFNQLVTLRQFLSTSFQRAIQRKYTHTDVIVLDTNSIFAPCKLRNALGPVFCWLHKNDIGNRSNFELSQIAEDRLLAVSTQSAISHQSNEDVWAENTSMLPIPAVTLSLKEEGHSKMKVKCSSGDIFKSNGCYIVVGGLTGLGWEIVLLLAEKGAGVIVIFSRRAPDSSQLKKIEGLIIQYKRQIISMQVDICDVNSVKNGINSAESQFPRTPIKGIFHGAGVLSDSLLIKMSDEKLESVLLPKVKGTWNLHLCSTHLQLDYFVMHSSIVSIIGNAGQTHYAAGNAFMDSVSHYRKAMRLCGQSINWGPMAVGMANNNAAVEEQMKKVGFQSLTVAEIRTCLLNALMTGVPQITYNSFDWSQFTKCLMQSPSKSWMTSFESLITPELIVHVTQTSVSTHSGGIDLRTLHEMSAIDQTEVILSIIYKTASEVFLVDIETLEPKTPFMTLGVDSMAAMSFVNRISESVGYEIPILKLLASETKMSDLADEILYGVLSMTKSTIDTVSLTPKTDISYIQEVVLKDYEQKPNDHTFLMLVDFEVAPDIPDKGLRKVLELVYTRHAQMRTIFKLSHGGNYEAIVLTPEDVGSETLIGFDEPLDMLAIPQRSDPRMNYNIDVTQELPVKFYLLRNACKRILRLVAHKIVFDLNSFGILKQDLYELGERVANNIITDVKPNVVNIQSTIKRFLKPRLNHLQEFWKQYLKEAVEPITLGDGRFQPINSIYNRYYSTRLPPRCQVDIFKFIQDRKITLFQFFASIYQLMLHMLTRKMYIPIITRVDLRVHIFQFRKVISRLINPFPLVAKINPDDSLESYVYKHAHASAEAVDNNMYPYIMTKQAMKESLVKNVERHGLNMAGLTNMDYYDGPESPQLKPFYIAHISGTYETHITVRYDRNSKTIDLECAYNEDIVDARIGNSMSQFMMEIIEHVTRTPSCRIKDLSQLGSAKHIEHLHFENTLFLGTDSNQREMSAETSITHPRKSDNFLNEINTSTCEKPPNTKISTEKEVGTNELRNQQNGSTHAIQENGKADSLSGIVTKSKLDVYTRTSYPFLTGYFKKQTSKGWDHRVAVTLESKASQFVLKWGKTPARLDSTLHSSTVQEISLCTMNGQFALMFRTQQRFYIFKTTTAKLAYKWMDAVKTIYTI
ncbi:hypothetical protein ACJMK2_000747 [Sinanodonta woodiana]|uniref:Uncharacterized protein n=1 Tax=Sinanodonta woodiana TaxID=1069815 RepID=A0ABD3XQ74_SINWO